MKIFFAQLRLCGQNYPSMQIIEHNVWNKIECKIAMIEYGLVIYQNPQIID